MYRPDLLPKVRSKAIMRAMEGQPCTIRIATLVPMRRCAGVETSVGAHLPIWGKGTSTKVTDMATACACSVCHDILDGRDRNGLNFITENYPRIVLERMLHGLTETHSMLIDNGVIIIPDARLI